MDNLFMVALQNQRVLRRQMEVVANNVANVSTTGFKVDTLRVEEHRAPPAGARDNPRDIRFVRDVTMVRDFSNGVIQRTGSPFDVAFQGEGFLTVQGPGGQKLYTRDGSLALDPGGTLVNREGLAVLNAQGQPIVFDPQGTEPTIAADGTIRIGAATVGQIDLVRFARPSALEKVGDNNYTAPPVAGLTRDGVGPLLQGGLENSNVNPVLEISKMIEVSRAYESATRLVQNADDLRRGTIERLGRASQ
jgi:flagellar basal-body rod protein FlgF